MQIKLNPTRDYSERKLLAQFEFTGNHARIF